MIGRTPRPEVRPASAQPIDAETVTVAGAADPDASPLALYVTGPHGGTRHLVPRGSLVRVGRGAGATIVINDPRVSRAHAAIHVTESPAVSDLRSANGT